MLLSIGHMGHGKIAIGFMKGAVPDFSKFSVSHVSRVIFLHVTPQVYITYSRVICGICVPCNLCFFLCVRARARIYIIMYTTRARSRAHHARGPTWDTWDTCDTAFCHKHLRCPMEIFYMWSIGHGLMTEGLVDSCPENIVKARHPRNLVPMANQVDLPLALVVSACGNGRIPLNFGVSDTFEGHGEPRYPLARKCQGVAKESVLGELRYSARNEHQAKEVGR